MSNNQDSGYCFSFPAVRGTQAGRPFYIATCPLRTIPKIFVFDEEEVPPELRAQRTLNKSRIPAMVKYLVENPNDYVFSALTVSVDTTITFTDNDPENTPNLGILKVPLDAQILINDGQHRRKAIEEALKQNPDLGSDNIPVLFFVDEGLTRSQQMFVDLNKYAVKPNTSLSDCYDKRDPSSEIARYLSANILPFKGFTEMEKSNISSTSGKLFTLSGIKQATRSLMGKSPKEPYTEQEIQIAAEFWQTIYSVSPEWKMVCNKELSPSQFRQEFIHAHGIGLHALGVMGHTLLTEQPDNWKETVKKLEKTDWRKSNATFSSRCINQQGRLSKATINIQLVANALKIELGLALSPEERALELQAQK
ncbi:DNA sulfur modification protein DndB [Colwellia sp. 1_MG-2023]|uniref:DNA sulfur modification protein DndB n=1 Tax=unclassified Colwellia TaxID=196834 RepID=UPI001C088183|nr:MULTISPECIES: DNA sulfur modification protein DndB [unclassified Colwellia]MBU2925805.1 DNA sulfur modification protein DndB [Colwellia sp. C2M11]MDO6650968.1 DNA sulfur modification protein DndB [Colwellia sp. 3_MG-2023]MDO6664003.1 DNA sulfur modification protein DndB [Colwellia sp. 2_MG-2023]MDO6688354.1 DNA sulfur modification protein DndB [Colwellia sp. 1_MG-2023]